MIKGIFDTKTGNISIIRRFSNHALINQELVITRYRMDKSVHSINYLDFDMCEILGVDMLKFAGVIYKWFQNNILNTLSLTH